MTQMTDAERGEHDRHPDVFKVRIDRETFEVAQQRITGQQLRELPNPPIGDDRDLYEEVADGDDKLIKRSDVVTLNEDDITAFFTSPTHVTPGA
jgi:hypothetical protein